DTIAKQDIVITTALIPGRPAPKLVTAAMVHSMKPGSVIVDMAVEQGGNCELAVAGEVKDVNGVTIIGYGNLASRLAASAALLYAKNLLSFLGLIIDKETGAVNVNAEDDVIKGVALTRGGAIVHPQFGKAA
ncbi:MAG: NAD(P)(+) transhydrogenase (Re/Si-specific) subunit alpha, partial [Alphaproteobacteria bacterium]|nr:NAD(P)(+) transhydrogenase (Re/Si-specific) subunit alpha [Alphaproteobacteria bacterium]